MRAALVAVALVASATPSDAVPARFEIYDEPLACPAGTTWGDVASCLATLGSVRELYKHADAKAVKVSLKTAAPSALILVYVRGDAGWRRASFETRVDDENKLLGATAFAAPNGTGVRIDIGNTVRSTFSPDGMAPSRPMLMRRTFTTVCTPTTWACHATVSACDLYVGGAALASFRTTPVWDSALGLRMRAVSTQAAGFACIPDATLLID